MNKMYALMPRSLPQALMRPMIGKHLLSHLAWAYGGFGESALASMELPNSVFRTQKASADLSRRLSAPCCRIRPMGFTSSSVGSVR